MASHRLGGLNMMSAAAAPYMPRPKKAEWPNEIMPVYPIRTSDDMASRPQIRISVRKRRQYSGSTSGATISSAMTTQKPIQKTAVWLNFVLSGFDLLSGAIVIWASEQRGRSAGTGA